MLNVGASVMNGGAGTGSVEFFHGFQVAIMMTIMFNLVQYVYWRCKASRKGSCLQVHRPTFLMLLSAIMTNFQPMGILVAASFKIICCPCEVLGGDAQCTATGRSFPPWPNMKDDQGNQIYRQCSGNGNWFWQDDHCDGSQLALFPNQTKGWIIQIVCTYGGFVVMFISVMLATQLHKKVQNKWSAIRAGR